MPQRRSKPFPGKTFGLCTKRRRAMPVPSGTPVPTPLDARKSWPCADLTLCTRNRTRPLHVPTATARRDDAPRPSRRPCRLVGLISGPTLDRPP